MTATPREGIAAMRRAGRVVAEVLHEAARAVRPGATTLELDALAEAGIRKRGCLPAFLGYRGYRHTLCTSVNEMVVHGVPGDRALREGDLIGLDLGAIADGWYADAAFTVPVGRVSESAQQLIRVTRESLERAIALVRPGQRVGDLSSAIQTHVEQNRCSVVRDFVGHGIGRALHEEPQIPNFGRPHTGPKLKAGMAICVEPMVNAGGPAVEILDDGWTVVAADRSLSAHFEHTLLLTDGAAEVLTPWHLDAVPGRA